MYMYTFRATIAILTASVLLCSWRHFNTISELLFGVRVLARLAVLGIWESRQSVDAQIVYGNL